jgi:hypothetical protein
MTTNSSGTLFASTFRGRTLHGPLCLNPKQDFFLTSSHCDKQPNSNTRTQKVSRVPKKRISAFSDRSQSTVLRVSKISQFCTCDTMIHPRLFINPYRLPYNNYKCVVSSYLQTPRILQERILGQNKLVGTILKQQRPLGTLSPRDVRRSQA